MSLLLDTHVLIWLAEGREDLPREARGILAQAAATGGLAVSSISFWEVAMLEARRRISLSVEAQQWRRRVLAGPDFHELALSGDVLIQATRLPGEPPADPADRILIATARDSGLLLATRDARILAYAHSGYLQALRV